MAGPSQVDDGVSQDAAGISEWAGRSGLGIGGVVCDFRVGVGREGRGGEDRYGKYSRYGKSWRYGKSRRARYGKSPRGSAAWNGEGEEGWIVVGEGADA